MSKRAGPFPGYEEFPLGSRQQKPFPPFGAEGGAIQVLPFIGGSRTITPTDQASDNTYTVAGGSFGSFFGGSISNKDASNILDAVLIVSGAPFSVQIPPGQSLALKNQKIDGILVQIDKANAAASIAYTVAGRVLVPLNPLAADELARDSAIFFRVSSVPGLTAEIITYTGDGNASHKISLTKGKVPIFGMVWDTDAIQYTQHFLSFAASGSAVEAGEFDLANLATHYNFDSGKPAGTYATSTYIDVGAYDTNANGVSGINTAAKKYTGIIFYA